MSHPAIFFDLDGTLVDSAPGIEASIRHAVVACGLELIRDVNPLIGPPIATILRNLLPHSTQSELAGMIEAYRAHYDLEGRKQTTLYPGVLSFLVEESNPYFIVTNKPVAPTDAILRMLGVEELFVDRFCNPPTKAAGVRELLEVYSVDPSKSFYVGDSPDDAEAAHANGIRFLYAAYGYGKVDAGKCHGVLAQFSDILKFVGVA